MTGGSTDKLFATIAAVAAQLGVAVWRSDPADGRQRFFAHWRGEAKLLADIDELEKFVRAVGRAQLGRQAQRVQD